MKLNSLKLALSAAILSALSMFLLVVSAIQLNRGVTLIKLLNPLLPGYNVSWNGAALGLVYGAVICFIYVGLLGWLYNCLLDWKGIKIKGKAKRAGKKRK